MVDLLTDRRAEIEEGEQQDVGESEGVPRDEFAPGDLRVEPFDPVLRGRFQPLGRFGKAAQPRLAQRQPFGEAEAVGQRLANLEVETGRAAWRERVCQYV